MKLQTAKKYISWASVVRPLTTLVVASIGVLGARGSEPTDSVARCGSLGCSPIAEAAITASPMLVGGVLLSIPDSRYRDYQGIAGVNVKRGPDYGLQYLPAATLLTMKLAGVESRTPWPQMLTSDVVSVAAMTAIVQTIKHTVSERRPDSSDRHSMPSGHTATAFMTATMLHHEYGERYPWLSVAGYATAATTGFMRVNGNHHWVSDVVTGAGIGILSAEVGYVVSDLIFGRSVLKDADYFDNDYEIIDYRPSGIGVYMSADNPLTSCYIDGFGRLSMSTGCTMGIDGWYYPGRYIGVGGKVGISDLRLYADDHAQPQQLKYVSARVGATISIPVSRRVLLDGTMIGGYANYTSVDLYRQRPDGGVDAYHLRSIGGVSAGISASVTIRLQRTLSYSLYCEYNTMPRLYAGSRGLQTLGIGVRLNLSVR